MSSPLGAGFTYSIDGTTYQTSPIFINLSPKSYNIILKNSSGCVSVPAFETISNVSPVDPINSVQYLCFDKTGKVIAPITIDTKLSPIDYSFVWTLYGISLGITTSSYKTSALGLYSIIATSLTGGCKIVFNTDVKESKEAIAAATVGNDFDNQQQIIVTVTGGLGNYEYQLDDGLPQSIPIFSVSTAGDYIVKVIDKLGCNNFLLPVNVLNYPRFFTPNIDGYNDTWNIAGLHQPEKAIIYIFDRYGKLLKQISPVGSGWDGIYNGVALPASDYWFRLLYQDSIGASKEFKAHFSLKR
ncbi:MAG: T9SS type B sorting domain-containing protein [Oligoflexus sp.]|nr:T9SS type B sorting domain-containing protein [Pseudopedobacter sp.]